MLCYYNSNDHRSSQFVILIKAFVQQNSIAVQ